MPLTIASRVRHMYAPSKCRHSDRWILLYELQTMTSESSEWLREPEGYQGGRVEPLGRLDPIALPGFLRALSGWTHSLVKWYALAASKFQSRSEWPIVSLKPARYTLTSDRLLICKRRR